MNEVKIPEKILLVDDEPNILAGYTRQLRKAFNVEIAVGGKQALEMIEGQGPYAVVVSDLRMPGMDGIELLSRTRDIAPDTVRMMLTGFADVDNAISAVNEGRVFRFLTKPCETATLVRALASGINQYRLITAEKELLHKTLTGSMKALVDILALLNPTALGRSARIQKLAVEIGREMKLGNLWPLETAALLSQMGMILVPALALEKLFQGLPLQADEREIFDMHPLMASDLLKHIPRLEEVRAIVAHQEKRFNGEGPPQETKGGEAIPLGGRILKVSSDYDLLVNRPMPSGAALAQMEKRRDWYDPKVLKALEAVLAKEVEHLPKEVGVDDLTESMVFAQDVRTKDGALVVPKGYRVTRLTVKLLHNFDKTVGLNTPLKVSIRPEE